MKGLVIGLVLVTAVALAPTASASDLALWTFEVSVPTTAGPHGAEGGVNAGPTSPANGWHADAGTVYSNPVGNGSSESFSSNHWAIGDYYQFETSTLGYQNISITWHQRPSGTGPHTFDLEWSTDGVVFTTLLDDYVQPDGTWSSSGDPDPDFIFGPIAGPAALDDQTTVYFRLVNQVAPGGTGGTNRVDNILITGSALSQSGACCVGPVCHPDQSPLQCAALGGIFMGDGTTCDPNPCVATGACCVGEVCSVQSAEDCGNMGGSYLGDGTTCTPNPCLICIDIPDAKALPNYTPVVLCDVVISNVIDLIQGSHANMHVQELDGSAGLALHSSNADDIAAILAEADLGDSIKIWGTTGSFYGLAQLDPPFYVENLGFVGIPDPLIVTGADFDPDAEAIESMLVEVECALFRDGGGTFTDHANYIVDDAYGSIIVRVSSNELGLNGVTIPDYPLNIRGIVDEYNGEYRILLRGTADLIDNPACLETGACCYDEVCVEQTPAECTSGGGDYQGDGTTCTPYNPCIPVWGACCVEGICFDVAEEADCDTLGGCWQGDYTECIDEPCNPPTEAGDVALGLSDVDPNVTLRHIRDYDNDGFGEPVGNWSAFPYVQSVEFDNTGGVLHNAHGNLLGLNFGVMVSDPPAAGEGGHLYNFATDGSNCGEHLYSFEVGEPYEINVTTLGVSVDNDYLSVWGPTTGSVYVLEYDEGLNPGTGAGASAGTQVWVHQPSGAITGKTQGTTWYEYDDGLDEIIRVVLLANVTSATSGVVKLNAVEFRPSGTPIFSESLKTTLYYPNSSAEISFTDVEYNPEITNYAFVLASFYSGDALTFLSIVDANTWSPITFTATGSQFLDVSSVSGTGREVALGPDGYLYWSMYSGGSDPHIMRIDVSGTTIALTDLTVGDVETYHYANSYSMYNGLDVAHDGEPLSGACCINDVCFMTNQAACAAAGGSWIGAGSACWPSDPCLPCTHIMAAKAEPSGTEVKFCYLVVSSLEDLVNSVNTKSFQAQHQDNTGGVTIYGSTEDIDALLDVGGANELHVGDEITIQGETYFSSGLFELSAYSGPILLTIHGNVGVSPVVVPAEYFDDGNPLAEVHESQLVTVECLAFDNVEPNQTFAYGNYSATTTDGSRTLTIRISREDAEFELVGTLIPTDPVNITGIFGQYDSDPWDGGYQLQPRFISDIVDNPNCPGALCLGDSNCDGVVNWRDIDFFVAAQNDNVTAWENMFDPPGPSCGFENNDVNKDGTVNWRDIDPFVAVMNKECPTGACCYGSGSCVMTDQNGCDMLSGDFHAGMTCDEVTCP
ncbi:MAG: hypothetical protein KAY37_13165 [Phycisphaerae bacterium]|nr:hypothetical protein [Phycisphaerae bacterium]